MSPLEGPSRLGLRPADLETLERLRERLHQRCFACGQASFRLEFELEDAGIAADLTVPVAQCGYAGRAHGGVLALYFDQIAACCLFAHGLEAVTGELRLRLRHPLAPLIPARLRASVERSRRPLHRVRMELVQAGRCCVRGDARMWERSPSIAWN